MMLWTRMTVAAALLVMWQSTAVSQSPTFRSAMELVNLQSTLGYQSSNQTHSGAFRRIALRIAVPGVKWRTRAGYLAERDGAAHGTEER